MNVDNITIAENNCHRCPEDCGEYVEMDDQLDQDQDSVETEEPVIEEEPIVEEPI